MPRKGKIVIYSIWVVIIVVLAILYFLSPETFSPKSITEFVKTFNSEMLWIYILLSLIRGFFLIPSTPFVLAGALLFPGRLLLILVISMIGIMLSATCIYYFSDFLGFSKRLDHRFSSKVNAWRSRFSSSKSVLFIAGWSLLPVVPTDFICYAGGILKAPFKYIFTGVFIGELILCSIYIYFGSNVLQLL
ncbi:VTT domain-containing protein [Flavobacteriaceae bacterium S356]|uniref:TVP38/TMEM64 family membrane protein n=1 Tax=Asprobacillus argus TaxID=3076534 RepID=A0ABU3LJ67_9FLAO|nr:VTT domain-containing protein [Flavobacteriaceae bacterium S356]